MHLSLPNHAGFTPHRQRLSPKALIQFRHPFFALVGNFVCVERHPKFVQRDDPNLSRSPGKATLSASRCPPNDRLARTRQAAAAVAGRYRTNLAGPPTDGSVRWRIGPPRHGKRPETNRKFRVLILVSRNDLSPVGFRSYDYAFFGRLFGDRLIFVFAEVDFLVAAARRVVDETRHTRTPSFPRSVTLRTVILILWAAAWVYSPFGAPSTKKLSPGCILSHGYMLPRFVVPGIGTPLSILIWVCFAMFLLPLEAHLNCDIT